MILLILHETPIIAYYDDKGRVRVEVYFEGWMESMWSREYKTIGDYFRNKKECYNFLEILHIDEEIQDEFC